MFAHDGKTGDDEGEKKTISRNPKETLTTSPEMTVKKRALCIEQ